MSLSPIHVASIQLLDASSMGADVTSDAVNINSVVCYSVHCVWENGSSTGGSLELQASNDNVNFVSVATQAIATDSGNYMFNVEKAGYSYFRIFYDRSAGSGDLTANYTLKLI
jgi:hypothetical protein